MNALLAYLFLALVISFICSLVEAVFLSIPRSYLNSIKVPNPELRYIVFSLYFLV